MEQKNLFEKNPQNWQTSSKNDKGKTEPSSQMKASVRNDVNNSKHVV